MFSPKVKKTSIPTLFTYGAPKGTWGGKKERKEKYVPLGAPYLLLLMAVVVSVYFIYHLIVINLFCFFFFASHIFQTLDLSY